MGRDDFTRTALAYAPMPDLSDGAVRSRVDRVGLNAKQCHLLRPRPAVALLTILPVRAAPSVAAVRRGVREILCACAQNPTPAPARNR
jgi:hypothetical protein